MSAHPSNHSLLTVAQVAEQLNLAERTIYALCQSGEIECRRLGPKRGAIRISQQALNRYLDPPQLQMPVGESLLDWQPLVGKQRSRSSGRIAG